MRVPLRLYLRLACCGRGGTRERSFLITPAGTQAQAFGKALEQTQLLQFPLPPALVLLALRPTDRRHDHVAHDLSNPCRQRVAVVRWRGEGDHAAAVTALH